jgi:hypothetical protein
MQMSGARADSRITIQAQTELNPGVQQQAAFNFSPISDDFDALSLRCNRESSFRRSRRQATRPKRKKYARFEAGVSPCPL